MKRLEKYIHWIGKLFETRLKQEANRNLNELSGIARAGGSEIRNTRKKPESTGGWKIEQKTDCCEKFIFQ